MVRFRVPWSKDGMFSQKGGWEYSMHFQGDFYAYHKDVQYGMGDHNSVR